VDERPAVRLNGELLCRERAARSFSRRALSRMTDIRVAHLTALENGASCEKLTVGSLSRLAAALCVAPESLLVQSAAHRDPEPDDVKVEAVLAQVGKAVNRDDIAWALDWSLERVNAALLALEARLQRTGQRLRRGKFGWFGLAATGDVLTVEESANIERATISEYGLKRKHAAVLFQLAAPGRRLSMRMGQRDGVAHDPRADLLRGQLIGIHVDGGLALCESVAFSLCVGRVATAPPRPIKPQDRNARAGYSINRVRRKPREPERG